MRVQCQNPAAGIAIGRDARQRRLNLALQLQVGERDRVGVLQQELLQPLVGHHADPRAGLGDAVGAAHRLVVDMQQPAADRLRCHDQDLGALQRVEQIDLGIERPPPERQIGEALGQRLAPGQCDVADRPLRIVDDEAFHHVVDLVERHVEAQRRIAVNLRLVFEITDPAGRQHHPLQHQVGRAGQALCMRRQDGEQHHAGQGCEPSCRSVRHRCLPTYAAPIVGRENGEFAVCRSH